MINDLMKLIFPLINKKYLFRYVHAHYVFLFCGVSAAVGGLKV